MAWYDESVFYHIYPLGLSGAPTQNDKGDIVHRLQELEAWIPHIESIGCNAIYIGPLFESVGHGYETTDYYHLDRRLGDNDDLKHFVNLCHNRNIRVIFDGVFNHTGREFFAFLDLLQNRENSQYKDWYCQVDFNGNNEYNDGFSYENWGGYNLLVKLNQHNPEVQNYIFDVIRFWVSEFDIDGIRLDAADVLDINFMKEMRQVANEVKTDFWLMGEVIHGEYNRWVNNEILHSVTNYHLNKALWSGCNDHNFFEIAHTVKRLYDMSNCRYENMRLYNFADNHDVERIINKLNNRRHFSIVHILLYTLPGIPSVYYGSEFGIEGKKEPGSDASLRPHLLLSDFSHASETNEYTALICQLGAIRRQSPALCYGEYRELLLTNQQYAYARSYKEDEVFIAVNNSDSETVTLSLPVSGKKNSLKGLLSRTTYSVENGTLHLTLPPCSGEILE